MKMQKKMSKRTVFTYAIMLVINPMIILLFQNCSVVRRSDWEGTAHSAASAMSKKDCVSLDDCIPEK